MTPENKQTARTLRLCCIGGGGHARVVIAAAQAAGFDVVGYLDKREADRMTVAYLGPDEAYEGLLSTGTLDGILVGIGAVNAKGEEVRKTIFDRMSAAGGQRPAILHPTALIARSSSIGEASVVLPRAVISEDVRIGNNVIINTGAIVEHDSTIGDHTHVAVGATICGGVSIGACCLIGARATIIQGVTVGPNAVIGAGATVIRDVPAGATVLCPLATS